MAVAQHYPPPPGFLITLFGEARRATAVKPSPAPTDVVPYLRGEPPPLPALDLVLLFSLCCSQPSPLSLLISCFARIASLSQRCRTRRHWLAAGPEEGGTTSPQAYVFRQPSTATSTRSLASPRAPFQADFEKNLACTPHPPWPSAATAALSRRRTAFLSQAMRTTLSLRPVTPTASVQACSAQRPRTI